MSLLLGVTLTSLTIGGLNCIASNKHEFLKKWFLVKCGDNSDRYNGENMSKQNVLLVDL